MNPYLYEGITWIISRESSSSISFLAITILLRYYLMTRGVIAEVYTTASFYIAANYFEKEIEEIDLPTNKAMQAILRAINWDINVSTWYDFLSYLHEKRLLMMYPP